MKKVSRKLVALCFCLPIVAVISVSAADVPDQTIGRWSAKFTEPASSIYFMGDDIKSPSKTKELQYDVSVSSGMLVIHEKLQIDNGEKTDFTYQIPVSKFTDIEDYDEKYYLALMIANGGAERVFTSDDPKGEPKNDHELDFSINDQTTHDFVKRKLNEVKAMAAATAVAPLTAVDYSFNGHAKKIKGDLDGAIADFTKAIELRPDYAGDYSARGSAKQDKGDLDGAIADYTKYIELEPETGVLVYNDRGNAELAKGAYDGAIADYTKAIGFDPSYGLYYGLRGDAKRGKGDKAGAVVDYFTAGNMWATKGDGDAAITNYTKVIELEPNHGNACYRRGVVKQAQNDFDGALADFDKVIALQPDSVIAYNSRGNVKNAKGDWAGAKADFIKALELKPDYTDARKALDELNQKQQPKVVSCDFARRFVVLAFPTGKIPKLNQVAFLYRSGSKVGEVKITGPQLNNNIDADLTSGEAQAGDEVRDQ